MPPGSEELLFTLVMGVVPER
eukprot:SAG22_NODE_3348_length_1764_cov_2.810210_3_plen_20_part_01